MITNALIHFTRGFKSVLMRVMRDDARLARMIASLMRLHRLCRGPIHVMHVVNNPKCRMLEMCIVMPLCISEA